MPDSEREGLAEYGNEDPPEELLARAAAYSGMSTLTANPDPAVLENLQGLYRLLVNRHLSTVQEWLRIIAKARHQTVCRPSLQAMDVFWRHHILLYGQRRVRDVLWGLDGQVDVGEPGMEQYAQREHMLRTALDLRSRITQAQDRYNALRAMLPAALPDTLPADKHNSLLAKDKVRFKAVPHSVIDDEPPLLTYVDTVQNGAEVSD